MALPSFSTGAEDQNQSSLRQAVDRILGFPPGGGGGGAAAGTSAMTPQGGGSLIMGAKDPLADISVGALPTDSSGYQNLATFNASGAGTQAPGGSSITFAPRKSFASFLSNYDTSADTSQTAPYVPPAGPAPAPAPAPAPPAYTAPAPSAPKSTAPVYTAPAPSAPSTPALPTGSSFWDQNYYNSLVKAGMPTQGYIDTVRRYDALGK